MAKLDYQEIIALSEDPNVTFEDVRGRPPTLDELDQLAEFADSIFYQCSFEERLDVTLCLPAHISARHLALLSDHERRTILSQLPADLAEQIVSLLPAGVS